MSAHYSQKQKQYTVFIKASSKHPISQTNDYREPEQKNFEIIKQTIGLRSLIHITSDPKPTSSLSKAGSSLSGKGYVFSFETESGDVFKNDSSGVGLLLEDLDGIVLHSKMVLKALGDDINIEVVEISGEDEDED